MKAEQKSMEEDLKIENESSEDTTDLKPMVLSDNRAVVPYDPLQKYLFEIKRYSLLSREEEL